jgi:hypothetical protein
MRDEVGMIDGATTESALCVPRLADPKALPEWQQNGCAQMYMKKESGVIGMKAIVRAGWAMLGRHCAWQSL